MIRASWASHGTAIPRSHLQPRFSPGTQVQLSACTEPRFPPFVPQRVLVYYHRAITKLRAAAVSLLALAVSALAVRATRMSPPPSRARRERPSLQAPLSGAASDPAPQVRELESLYDDVGETADDAGSCLGRLRRGRPAGRVPAVPEGETRRRAAGGDDPDPFECFRRGRTPEGSRALSGVRRPGTIRFLECVRLFLHVSTSFSLGRLRRRPRGARAS